MYKKNIIFKNNIMSKIIIEEFNYPHLLVIDNDKYEDNIYQNFINILKNKNVINTNYNKINFLINNTCIIYNVNDDNNEYDIIKQFKEYYKDKMKKHNIKLLLLNREDNKIYVINSNQNKHIITHSKLIKKLFNIDYFNLLVKFIIINYNDVEIYINQLIKQLLINIVEQNKLNKKCFNNCYNYIYNWNKSIDNNIKYFNKTVIIKC